MISPIIIALDMDAERARLLVRGLDPNECRLKVGNQLFTSNGPKIVEELKNLGFDVFLDLKYHDIPNTVSAAVKEACKLGVWMLNVHASGGGAMMRSAVNETLNYSPKPLIVGVTLLTSIDKEEAKLMGIKDISFQTSSLAFLSRESGLDGVVCSPHEVKFIKENCGKEFIAVTPGIRSSGQEEDQKRVATAKEAIQNGADYLVIGRPITESSNPLKSLQEIIKEIT